MFNLATLYPTCILLGILILSIVSSWVLSIILATYISKGEREAYGERNND